MGERPILFSAPMVRALLAGTKTQTRRAIKHRMGSRVWQEQRPNGSLGWTTNLGHAYGNTTALLCPYGQAGDQLWVREAFMHEPADYCWEASVSIPSRPASTVYRADFPESQPGEGWKPSIHMPRKLSRIQLEVTGVRVERLQAISEADAIAEGIQTMAEHDRDMKPTGRTLGLMKWPGDEAYWDTPRNAYASLWEQINGPGGWDANPRVWVVEFRRLKP